MRTKQHVRWPFAVIAMVLAVAALVSVQVVASEQPAAAATKPARVGWWVGGFALDCPQGGCPLAYPEELWQALRETDSFLGIGLTYTVDYGPGATATDLPNLVKKALEEDVEVLAWILAPASHGTFANENNAAYMREAVEAFDAWNRTEGFKISEAILDLELPAGYQVLTDLQEDPSALLNLNAPIDTAHQCEAVRSYEDTIAWAHGRGLELTGSPIPFALDDLADGNMALADVLDLAPLLPGYDRMYVQAYRTYSQPGPDYVAGYFRESRKHFGLAGEVTLGDTTLPGVYDKVGPLVQDVRLLAGMGASRIPVFNLEGSYKKYGTAGIRAVGDAPGKPMTALEISAATVPNPLTMATRGFFGVLNTVASTLSPTSNRYPPAC
jgi:hypothetical protein